MLMLITIVLTSIVVVAATTPIEKEYTVKATLPKYVKFDKWLSIAKTALAKSDLPSRDVTMILDSLTEFQNVIVLQINTQLEADKKLSDSTSKKPKQ